MWPVMTILIYYMISEYLFDCEEHWRRVMWHEAGLLMMTGLNPVFFSIVEVMFSPWSEDDKLRRKRYYRESEAYLAGVPLLANGGAI